MKEAGYENGFDLGKYVASPIYLRTGELVQAQLKKIGITFEIQMVDHPTMHKMIRNDVNPLIPYGCARFPVADVLLTQFYHSKSIIGKPTGVTNFSHYGEVIPGVDDLIDAARVEPDIEKQKALWIAAQQKIIRPAGLSAARGLPAVRPQGQHRSGLRSGVQHQLDVPDHREDG